MRIYFYDTRKNLRVLEVGNSEDQELDFSNQSELKRWVQLNTGIKVNSPILGIYNGEKKD